MRVVFAGTPQVAVPSLEALVRSRHDVVAVVTRPDARAGRGRRLRPSPVHAVADEHAIPVLSPVRADDSEFLAALREFAPDVCAAVAYGALLKRAALDIPARGWVNLHFSLLPAWRGAAPVQHALIHGDEITGASVFEIEEGLDTGPVLGSMTERVRERDTAGDLLTRLADGGSGLLVACLDGMEDGSITPVAQSEEGVSLAPKISVKDARIDWRQPAFAIDRRVRGCTPAPGAWTTFRGTRLKVGPVEPLPAEGDQTPGAMRVAKHEVAVATGSGSVRLTWVQQHGKKQMGAADWARGARIASGESLDG